MRYLWLLMLIVISGCGGTPKIGGVVGTDKTKFKMDNGTHYKIGKKYYIDGVAYYPREDYNYTEEGIASWYGPKFHAKSTANGAVFDMRKFTAAHRTLPLPSVVRVTNIKNGRSMIVKVNDRGPYAKDRIIDLSRATAKRLGFIKQGTAFVRVEIMPELSRQYKVAMARGHSAPQLNHRVTRIRAVRSKKSKIVPLKIKETRVTELESGVYIQVGVFEQYKNALRIAQRVESYGEMGKTKLYKTEQDDGNMIYAVRIGPLEYPNKARYTMNLLLNDGISAIIKVL